MANPIKKTRETRHQKMQGQLARLEILKINTSAPVNFQVRVGHVLSHFSGPQSIAEQCPREGKPPLKKCR